MADDPKTTDRTCDSCGDRYCYRDPGSYTDEDGLNICPACGDDFRGELPAT